VNYQIHVEGLCYHLISSKAPTSAKCHWLNKNIFILCASLPDIRTKGHHFIFVQQKNLKIIMPKTKCISLSPVLGANHNYSSALIFVLKSWNTSNNKEKN